MHLLYPAYLASQLSSTAHWRTWAVSYDLMADGVELMPVIQCHNWVSYLILLAWEKIKIQKVKKIIQNMGSTYFKNHAWVLLSPHFPLILIVYAYSTFSLNQTLDQVLEMLFNSQNHCKQYANYGFPHCLDEETKDKSLIVVPSHAARTNQKTGRSSTLSAHTTCATGYCVLPILLYFVAPRGSLKGQ